jgi:hypothetical protein
VKITFEGDTLGHVFTQMQSALDFYRETAAFAGAASAAAVKPVEKPVENPVEMPVEMPVEKPVETFMDMPPSAAKSKPKRARTEKQRENDERLRVAAKAKIAAKQAAKTVSDPMVPPIPPPPKSAEGMDPAEVVKIRVKTIEELQAAYANGFQKEVFELLARFGNGAKSFRELPVEAFVPIREAIDNGALT